MLGVFVFLFLTCIQIIGDLYEDYIFWSQGKKFIMHLIFIILTLGMQWCYWWCCWHHVMLRPAPMVSHDQRNHVAPNFSCLDVRNALALLTILLASHDASSGVSDQKSCCTQFQLSLTWGMQWYHCRYYCHYVTLMPTPMATYDQKSNLESSFSWYNLRNGVVPLMMLLAAYDTDASANGIKLPQSHATSHFNCLYLRNAIVQFLMPLASGLTNTSANFAPHFDYLTNTNGVVALVMPLASHDTDAGANGIQWPKSNVSSKFWSSWPNKWNGPIDDTVGLMWHWQKHQWHYMGKRVMLHLIWIILKEQMQWCHWWYHWHHIILMQVPMASHDKMAHWISFLLSWSNKWNGTIEDTVDITYNWHQHHGNMWPNKLWWTLFKLSWPKEYDGAIDNGIGITWC